jgi:hypothetical protein
MSEFPKTTESVPYELQVKLNHLKGWSSKTLKEKRQALVAICEPEHADVMREHLETEEEAFLDEIFTDAPSKFANDYGVKTETITATLSGETVPAEKEIDSAPETVTESAETLKTTADFKKVGEAAKKEKEPTAHPEAIKTKMSLSESRQKERELLTNKDNLPALLTFIQESDFPSSDIFSGILLRVDSQEKADEALAAFSGIKSSGGKLLAEKTIQEIKEKIERLEKTENKTSEEKELTPKDYLANKEVQEVIINFFKPQLESGNRIDFTQGGNISDKGTVDVYIVNDTHPEQKPRRMNISLEELKKTYLNITNAEKKAPQKEKNKNERRDRNAKFEKIRDMIEQGGIDVIMIHGGKKSSRKEIGEGLSDEQLAFLGIKRGETMVASQRDFDTIGAQYMLSKLKLAKKDGEFADSPYNVGAYTLFAERGEQIDPNDPRFKGKNVLSLDLGNDKEYGVVMKTYKNGKEENMHVSIDHHQENKQSHQVATTELVYNLGKRLNLLGPKEKEKLERIAKFITNLDDLTYPFTLPKDRSEWIQTGYGLANNDNVPATILIQMMDAGINLDKPLDIAQMQKIVVGMKTDAGVDFEYNPEKRNELSQSAEFLSALTEREAQRTALTEKIVILKANKNRTPDEEKELSDLHIELSKLNSQQQTGDFVTLWDRAQKSKFDLEKSMAGIHKAFKHQKDLGLKTENEDLGHVLVNRYKGGQSIPMGFDAVRALELKDDAGKNFTHDSFVAFHTKEENGVYETTGFMISSQKDEKHGLKSTLNKIKSVFPDAKMIRGNMILCFPKNGQVNPDTLLEILDIKEKGVDTATPAVTKASETKSSESTSTATPAPEANPRVESQKDQLIKLVENLMAGDTFIHQNNVVTVEKIEGGKVFLRENNGDIGTITLERLRSYAQDESPRLKLNS